MRQTVSLNTGRFRLYEPFKMRRGKSIMERILTLITRQKCVVTYIEISHFNAHYIEIGYQVK
jgi:hypothetical protein